MKRLGWLIAREHMKTQIITVADSIRRIAEDPNPRGAIFSGIRDNAVKMLMSVKAQWESNQVLQWLYPYRLPGKSNIWNQDALVFNGRTTVHKEPCLEARGADSELTSAHYDWVKADDLVGRENSRTEDQLAKTIEWWKLAQPLISPMGEVDLIGTRYSDGDLYGWLMEIKSPIDWRIVPATKQDPETGLEEPNWPEYHSMESLQQKKIDMGDYDYSCQMDVDPIPKGAEEFEDRYFYLYDDKELDKSLIKHVATVCDPAYTDKQKAAGTPDFSAIVTGGMHQHGMLVVVDIAHGQVGTAKTVAWMHRHQAIWGSKVGVETQSALEAYLDLHNQQHPHKRIRYQKLKTGNVNKDARIRTLIPIAAKKPIWLPKNNPHTQTLLGQLKRFPKSKKRDLMDALAYLPQMVRAVRLNRAGDVTFEQRDSYKPDNDVTGY
jgi:hypothetical protein